MKVLETALPGVLILEPAVFEDRRGYFLETYHQERYDEAGLDCSFVQDNLSYSAQGTLRGLHYQYPHGQAKLVQVIKGEVFDVAVDIRRSHPLSVSGSAKTFLIKTGGKCLFLKDLPMVSAS